MKRLSKKDRAAAHWRKIYWDMKALIESSSVSKVESIRLRIKEAWLQGYDRAKREQRTR